MEEEKKESEDKPATEKKKPETSEPETTEKKPETKPSIETFEKKEEKPEIKVAERQEPSEEKPEIKTSEPEVKIKKPKFKVDMPKMKKPKMKFSWKAAAVVAVILLIISLIGNVMFAGSDGISGALITSDDAGSLALGYVTSELINPAVDVDTSVANVEEEELYFAVTLLLETAEDSQELEVYISKNGEKIFLGADDLIESYEPEDILTEDDMNVEVETEEVVFPTAETPDIKLFVMSFCPFGTQAEAAMAPVFDLLNEYADFNLNYIVTVMGENMSAVRSLHGAPEAEENARQLCILEEYDAETLWGYVAEFAEAYSSGDITLDNVGTEWMAIAESVDIDTDKIESCYEDMAFELTSEDAEVAEEYGATGSPTLIINEQEYRGARTPEAFKTAICSAFEEAPEACEKDLSELSGAGSSGEC